MTRELHQFKLVLRSGYPSERSRLRVRQLPALHHLAQRGEILEGTGHADFLACRSHGDAGAPAQPVGARLEARVPAASLVELTDQDQETVGGRMDVGGEFRDLIAEPHEVVGGEGLWGGGGRGQSSTNGGLPLGGCRDRG